MHENPRNAASQCETEKKKKGPWRGRRVQGKEIWSRPPWSGWISPGLLFSRVGSSERKKKYMKKKLIYKSSSIKEREGKRWNKGQHEAFRNDSAVQCLCWPSVADSSCEWMFLRFCPHWGFFFFFYFHGFKPALLHSFQSFTIVHSLDSRAAACAASPVSCGFIEMRRSCARNNCRVESRDQTHNIVLSASLGGLEAARLVALQRRQPSHCNHHRSAELFPQLTQLLM